MDLASNRQKDIEEFLIREFVCDVLHYTISRFEACENPDAILTLREGNDEKRVAIEHTGYFNDTIAGQCSPLTPISDFWKCVHASLADLISDREHLADIFGTVDLCTRQSAAPLDLKTRESLARQLAEQIVAFLEVHPITDSARFPSHSVSSLGNEFSAFPTLKSMVRSMRLRRIPEIGFSPCHWRCSNITTGSIGLNVEYIKTAVRRKSEKAAQYNWRSAEEKWLLIVAAGGNLSENVGPLVETEWKDPDLGVLCCASPFDRIYFWERVRRWCYSIKSGCRIVCEE